MLPRVTNKSTLAALILKINPTNVQNEAISLVICTFHRSDARLRTTPTFLTPTQRKNNNGQRLKSVRRLGNSELYYNTHKDKRTELCLQHGTAMTFSSPVIWREKVKVR